MYLEVTNECNFNCSFCVTDSKQIGNGEYMTLETVANSLLLLNENETIFLGGGEPTIHPNILEIVDMCIASGHKVHLTTNGSKYEICEQLISKDIGLILSLDEWHEEIPSKNIQLFCNPDRPRTSIRITTKDLIRKDGRSTEGLENFCCKVHGRRILPSGELRGCGCKDNLTEIPCDKPMHKMPKSWTAKKSLPDISRIQFLDELSQFPQYYIVGSAVPTLYNIFPQNKDIDIRIPNEHWESLNIVPVGTKKKIGNIHVLPYNKNYDADLLTVTSIDGYNFISLERFFEYFDSLKENKYALLRTYHKKE